ncbi:MAG: GNAT family N-acetyltransferase [Firmicutes bacterium]|nr:GNAT family N-acetyltransferase [Bacillota bacterium]
MKTLETQRLILRLFTKGDLDDMYEYASVDGVGEAAGWKHHESKDESQTILDKFIKNGDVYAIILKETGKVIGSVGIHKGIFNEKLGAKNPFEIGYALGMPYWGHSLATEATKAAIKYAFEGLSADLLWCGHYLQNARSKRVIEKCGFAYYCDGIFEAKPLGMTFEGKRYILTREQYERNNKNN